MIGKSSPFFLAQRIGHWRWPWLLASVTAAAITFGALTLAVLSFAFGAQEVLDADWAREFNTYIEAEDSGVIPTSPGALLLALYSVGLPFWGAALVGSLVHRRPPLSLIAPLRDFQWPLVGKVLALETILQSCLAALFIVDNQEVTFTGLGVRHLAWLAPFLVITLVQTTGEDVFFKGYLLRQVGALTRVAWLAPVLITSIFVLIHVGNPDLETNIVMSLLVFAASELMIIYFLLRTGGMEIPFVLHWTNNIVLLLFIAEAGTQANDLTLWVTDPPPEDATFIASQVVPALVYFAYMGALTVGLLWPRSPFYVGPRPVIDLPAASNESDRPIYAPPTVSP